MTDGHRKLGPMYYIAPEMLNQPDTSDGKKADVYSLAKILWTLGSGQNYPLPGTHRIDEKAMTLSAWRDHRWVPSLDYLLEATTQLDPNKRPTMSQFAEELSQLLSPSKRTQAPDELSRFKAEFRYAQRSQIEAERLSDVYNRASAERLRVLRQFKYVLQTIKEKLEREVDAHYVELLDWSRFTDATIYREVTGNQAAGSTDELFNSCTLKITLNKGTPASNRPWYSGTLIGGINLGLKTRNADPSLIDVHAPVVVAAGYVLSVTINEVGQREKENTIRVWGEAGEFLFGAPSEPATMDRLTEVMWANLEDALETLLRTYETMDLTAAASSAPSRA